MLVCDRVMILLHIFALFILGFIVCSYGLFMDVTWKMFSQTSEIDICVLIK